MKKSHPLAVPPAGLVADRGDVTAERRSGGVRTARRRRGRRVAAGSLALSLAAAASGESIRAEPVELPEIVVTPTREAEERRTTPATIDVVKLREDGAAGLARSLPEALRECPSVMGQKTAHGMGSPFLRGFTGFRTLALIDGIRLNNSAFREGPNQYWATVDPLALDRLEVMLGPASVLYGSDAIGGTLNALPPAPPAEPGWGGRVRYRASTAESSHGGRVEVHGRPSDEFGFVGGLTLNTFGDLRGGADVERQRRTGYDEFAGDARLVWDLGPDWRLTLAHQSHRQDDVWRTHRTVYGIGWKGLSHGDDLEHVFDQGRDLTYVRLESRDGAGSLTLYRHAQVEDLRRVREDSRIDLQGFDVTAWGLNLQASRDSAFGRWTAGADYQLDVVDSYGRQYAPDGTLKKISIQGPVADDALYHLAGAYLQNRLPLSDDRRFELVAGGRYTYARAEADRAQDPVSGEVFRIDDDWNALVGSLRGLARLDADGRSVIYTGVSQGFRAPNLSDVSRLDIARSNELEVPTRDLDPEYYTSFEVGARVDVAPVAVEAAIYHTEIDGMIVRAPTGRTLEDGLLEVVKRNAGDGYVRGAEGRVDIALAPEWTLWGQAIWMEGEVDAYPESTTVMAREPVSRLMPTTFRAGLRWADGQGRWWLEAVGVTAEKADRLSASDRRDTQRIPPGGTPAYTVAHLRGGARIAPGLRVALALENVFDADYRIHGSGVNEPGRNLVVAAEWSF